MIRTYSAISGQSLFDICLQVYGTLNLLYKLLQDSGIDNVNVIPRTGQQFTYDDELQTDQALNNQFLLSNILYATNTGDNGDVYYIIKQLSAPRITPGVPILPPNTNEPTDMYQKIMSTSFTSGADGTTEIYPLDADGNSMAGNKYDIVQIEKEIKPLRAVEFVWNKLQGKITLIGTTVDENQNLFILYSQMVNS